MKLRESTALRVNIHGRFLQRGALFFLISALIIGLIEPGMSTALALANTDKKFDTNYDLAPLESIKTEPTQILTQTLGNPLDTPKVENPRGFKYEDTSLRTPHTSTYVNNDGSKTMKYSSRQLNYSDGSTWKKIDNDIIAIQKKLPSPNFFEITTNTVPVIPISEEFNGRAGKTSVGFKSLKNGIKLETEGKTIVMKPIGAKDVKPVKRDDSIIVYKEAWPNVDIEYELHGETVKEVIILKNKEAKSQYLFSVSGGKVISHPTRAGELTIEGLPDEYSFSSLTLGLQDRGIISEERVTQAPSQDGKGIIVSVDKQWLSEQPDSSFPMYIDPTYNVSVPTYWMFKSDGYSCNANNCHANIGAINDGTWKYWRTYVQFPFSNLAGKKILNATLHGTFQSGKNGDTAGRNIWMGHANCVSFHCTGAQVGHAGGVGTNFDINFTNGLQARVNSADWGAVWSLWGEESNYKTFKPYYEIVAYTTYDTPTPIATPAAPTDKQTIVNTQPSLKVN